MFATLTGLRPLLCTLPIFYFLTSKHWSSSSLIRCNDSPGLHNIFIIMVRIVEQRSFTGQNGKNSVIFKVTSINTENPLLPQLTGWVIREGITGDFTGKDLPGDLYRDEFITQNMENTFNLRKVVKGEEISLFQVFNRETGEEVGYLASKVHYAPETRSGASVDRNKFDIIKVTHSADEWEELLGTDILAEITVTEE